MLHEQFKNNQCSSTRLKLLVLIMQTIGFRDIIDRLIHNNTKDRFSFQWQKQVRCYNNLNEIQHTKYLTKHVEYGFEMICPHENYAISSLNQRQLIDFVNISSLGYLPVTQGKNHLVETLCISNARHYYSVKVKSNLSSNYIHNICQGALACHTYL